MALWDTFYDDFEDNTRDAAKWNAYPTDVSESTGALRWSGINGNRSVTAIGTRDLLGSSMVWDTALEAGSSYGNNYFQMILTQGNYNTMIGWQRDGTRLAPVYGSTTIASTLQYDTPTRYLRVRATANIDATNHQVIYDTSPDGSTWTTRHTQNVPKTTYTLLAMPMEIRLTNYQGSPLARTPVILAVNPASVPPPVTGPQVWVWNGTTKLAATAKVWDGSSKLAATPKIAP